MKTGITISGPGVDRKAPTLGAALSGGSTSGEHLVQKAVTLKTGAQLGSWEIDQGIRLNLAGSVTVQPPAGTPPAATVKLGGYVGTVVSGILGSTASGTALTLANSQPGSRGLLAVTGAVDPTIGSVAVDGAGLLLSSVPAGTFLSAVNGGYIGIAPGSSGSAPPCPSSTRCCSGAR